MKQLSLLTAFIMLTLTGFAQSNSGIAMKVLDKNGEGLVNWPVKIYQGGREVMTVYTDEDGEALAKPLLPNVYEVRVENNRVTRRVDNINLGIAETPSVTVDFRTAPNMVPPTICYRYYRVLPKPMLRSSSNSTITAAELEAMPVF